MYFCGVLLALVFPNVAGCELRSFTVDSWIYVPRREHEGALQDLIQRERRVGWSLLTPRAIHGMPYERKTVTPHATRECKAQAAHFREYEANLSK